MKIALLILGLILAGCSGGADQESAAVTEDKDNVFDPMTDQIDKAEAVEDEVMQQKEDIDDAMQEAEDSVEDPPEAVDEMAEDSGE